MDESKTFDIPKDLLEFESTASESSTSTDSIMEYSFEVSPPEVSPEDWAKVKVDLMIDNIVKLESGIVNTDALRTERYVEIPAVESRIAADYRKKNLESIRSFEYQEPFRFSRHTSPEVEEKPIVGNCVVPPSFSPDPEGHQYNSPQPSAPVQIEMPQGTPVADDKSAPNQDGAPDEVIIHKRFDPIPPHSELPPATRVERLQEGVRSIFTTIVSATASAYTTVRNTFQDAWFSNRKRNPRDVLADERV